MSHLDSISIQRIVCEILHESVGVLRYSGINRLALEIDQGLADFYRSLIPKTLPCNRPRWRAHVTVVREEKEELVNREFWGRYEGQQVLFLYSPVVQIGQIYAWLNVFCTKLEDIRLELGLPCVSIYTLPPEGFKRTFHTTIANFK